MQKGGNCSRMLGESSHWQWVRQFHCKRQCVGFHLLSPLMCCSVWRFGVGLVSVVPIIAGSIESDPMNVSVQSVTFRDKQTLQLVLMHNASPKPLIFKIKITNTDLFSISPGKGALKPSEKKEISIRLNRFCNINAKLLISYAEVEQLTTESIDQQLAKFDKEALSNIIIPITRTEVKEKEEKREEKAFFKKTESPIYQLDIEAEEEQSSKPKAGNTSTGLKKSLSINSSSNLYRSVEDLDRRETNMSKANTAKLEKQLESARELNKKMNERLLQKERKIEYYKNLKQIEVNQSMNRREQEAASGFSCCNALLAAFILMMVGFFLAKHQLPSL